jgi:hypothetical protein
MSHALTAAVASAQLRRRDDRNRAASRKHCFHQTSRNHSQQARDEEISREHKESTGLLYSTQIHQSENRQDSQADDKRMGL